MEGFIATPVATPEPSSLVMLLAGLTVLGLVRVGRRRGAA